MRSLQASTCTCLNDDPRICPSHGSAFEIEIITLKDENEEGDGLEVGIIEEFSFEGHIIFLMVPLVELQAIENGEDIELTRLIFEGQGDRIFPVQDDELIHRLTAYLEERIIKD